MSAALVYSRAARHEGVCVNPASPIRRLAAHWPLALVCALFLFAGAFALDDYSRAHDAGHQRAIGNAALDYLAGDGERAFDQLLIAHDRYYGAVLEAPLVLLERVIGPERQRDVYRSRHLLRHLLFLTGGVFCYLLVLRMFASRPLALLAMLLFLLHPRIYAHSFFNPKDVPFAAMFMVSLYLVHRAFRRDTLAAFILCGVAVGLLTNLRIMGVILFAAVLAMRALDLAFAGSADGRARPLLTGGAFALAAALTYYASLPVLWTDPFGRFAELTGVLGAHPNEAFNLFRGEWLYSPNGPPWDYAPVWVGITTPPATLLLALIGTLALAWRGLRRPRDVLRNGPLRFGFLLAILPVATVVAIVVLETNVYGAWRHLYFLYAPLIVLAVLALPLLRGRWMRAAAHALAAAAIAVALVSLVRIHPYQPNYFNVLVDRTTPERLNSLYAVRYWSTGLPILKDIIRDHPSGALHLSVYRWHLHRAMLPTDDRQRIVPTRDFRSGEPNFIELHHGQPCPPLFPDRRYVARVYAVTLHCVVDPVAWLGDVRREALATEPLIRSTYDIYRDGRLLTYLRDGCSRDAVAGDGPRFFLHLVPRDAGDVPPEGFQNLDRPLRGGSARIDGNCVATVVLPDYPIAGIRTGQLANDGVLWEVDVAFGGGGELRRRPTGGAGG